MATLAALGVGAAVGLGVYYLARLFLSREELPDPGSARSAAEAADRLGTGRAERTIEPGS